MSKKDKNLKPKKNPEDRIGKLMRDFYDDMFDLLQQVYENAKRNSDKIEESDKKLQAVISKNNESEFGHWELYSNYETHYRINKGATFIDHATFVLLHSIFERYINQLIDLSVTLNLNVRKKYDLLINEQNQKRESEVVNWAELRYMDEDQATKLLLNLKDILFGGEYGLGYLEVLVTLFNIDGKKFNRPGYKKMKALFYESRERRNLIVHRGIYADEKYYKKISKLDLPEKYSEHFLDKLKDGRMRVRTSIDYFQYIHQIMVIIFTRFYSFAFARKFIETPIYGVMHECITRSDQFSKIFDFLSSLNLSTCELIFDNFYLDHQFSKENELGFYTNLSIALKKKLKYKKSEEREKFLNFLNQSKKIFFKDRLGECIFNVLQDNKSKALEILSGLHNHEHVNEDSFHTWSIFEDLRSEEKFKKIFKKFYKKSFKISNTP